DDLELPQARRFIVRCSQGRQKQRILKSELKPRVSIHCLQAWAGLIRSEGKTFILIRVELEVAFDELDVIGGFSQAAALLILANPAMEFCPETIEVSGLRTFFALANGVSILTPQPRFDGISWFLLAEFEQAVGRLLPNTVDAVALGLIPDVGNDKTFQHVQRREGEAAIIHRLKNGGGVVVGVGRDLDDVDIIEQPV